MSFPESSCRSELRRDVRHHVRAPLPRSALSKKSGDMVPHIVDFGKASQHGGFTPYPVIRGFRASKLAVKNPSSSGVYRNERVLLLRARTTTPSRDM
jgi:hypothetical protein